MKKKILIVDDKTEFRILTKTILSKNYEVESAENGVKFITHLQKNRSCLVASLQKQLGVALQNYYQAVMICPQYF